MASGPLIPAGHGQAPAVLRGGWRKPPATLRPSAISPLEALALARLRQWAADVQLLRKGNGVQLVAFEGRRSMRTACYDARLVRVIDFEKALATLPGDVSALLILAYRDKEPLAGLAAAFSCSVRTIQYKLPQARQLLASVLDRRDLL